VRFRERVKRVDEVSEVLHDECNQGLVVTRKRRLCSLTRSRLLSFKKHSTHQVMCAPLQRTHGRAAVAVMGSVDEISFFSSLTRSHTQHNTPGDKQGAMQSLRREQKRGRGPRCALLKGSSNYRCCETQPFPRVRLRIPPLTHRGDAR
jgi:hypothetical protein